MISACFFFDFIEDMINCAKQLMLKAYVKKECIKISKKCSLYKFVVV